MTFPKLAAAPKMSKTKALNEKCKQCIYDPAIGGSWRAQVEDCTTSSCPLWQHRPCTTKTISIKRLDKVGKGEIDIDGILDGLEDDEDADTEVESAA